jgi:hypothetical protein
MGMRSPPARLCIISFRPRGEGGAEAEKKPRLVSFIATQVERSIRRDR